ncbi:MAG: hypothetical protein OFPII_19320 [Osedax symbiont Rs1]|nr:MAG: hypothetical protein OFPII_19320 [Osedax symbiont Rs1]
MITRTFIISCLLRDVDSRQLLEGEAAKTIRCGGTGYVSVDT